MADILPATGSESRIAAEPAQVLFILPGSGEDYGSHTGCAGTIDVDGAVVCKQAFFGLEAISFAETQIDFSCLLYTSPSPRDP